MRWRWPRTGAHRPPRWLRYWSGQRHDEIVGVGGAGGDLFVRGIRASVADIEDTSFENSDGCYHHPKLTAQVHGSSSRRSVPPSRIRPVAGRKSAGSTRRPCFPHRTGRPARSLCLGQHQIDVLQLAGRDVPDGKVTCSNAVPPALGSTDGAVLALDGRRLRISSTRRSDAPEARCSPHLCQRCDRAGHQPRRIEGAQLAATHAAGNHIGTAHPDHAGERTEPA